MCAWYGVYFPQKLGMDLRAVHMQGTKLSFVINCRFTRGYKKEVLFIQGPPVLISWQAKVQSTSKLHFHYYKGPVSPFDIWSNSIVPLRSSFPSP